MPSFQPGPNYRHPFGKNEYLGSTTEVGALESGTCAASTVPTITKDGFTFKELQPGVVLAKITSGGEIGKVGPFQAGVSDGRQTLTNIVGINNTFLPWQLNERDVEVAYHYDAIVIQALCLILDSSGNWIALDDTTAAAMVAKKSLEITFRKPAADSVGTEELVTGW